MALFAFNPIVLIGLPYTSPAMISALTDHDSVLPTGSMFRLRIC